MRWTWVTVVVLAAMAGCQTADKPSQGAAGKFDAYQTVAKDPQRNTQGAGEHNVKAVDLVASGDLAGAEKELKEALSQDLFFGPAHNNLGLVYFRQKKYYQSAWEFQYAAKLMPNKAEPSNNLGMVYDAVGKPDDAAKYYETALKLEPGSSEIMGNLARLYVAENRNDARTRELLNEVVLRDSRPEWVSWARERLALMRKPEAAEEAPVAPESK